MTTTIPFGQTQEQDCHYLLAVPTTATQQVLDVTKERIGPAYDSPYYPETVVDMRPAGLNELWSIGWRQRLLKYDLQLNLVSVVNTYNAPKPNNNYCFARDMAIDFANGLVFMCCWSYNVIRVYDLQTFIDESYVRGANNTGGHLYDIGLANGSSNWFRADKNSATRNGEGGALYNVGSCDIDGTGKLLVACYQGHGNASSTSNSGFIAQYSYTNSGATFDRIIAARTGTYANADTVVKTTFRYPYGKLRFRPGTRQFAVPSSNHAESGAYGYHVFDLDNLNGSIEERTFPTDNLVSGSFRPHGLSYDSNGNIILTNRLAFYAVLEENSNRELVSVAGTDSSGSGDSYQKFQFPTSAIKLEAVNGRDWLVVTDYSAHKISIMPFPNSTDAEVSGDIEFELIDGQSVEFPEGCTVVKQCPPGATVDVDAKTVSYPIASLSEAQEIVLLLE